jgi:hypothetical protein
MAFLSTFAGLTLSLVLWVALYTLASNSQSPLLVAAAPYLEALSITGQCLFVVFAGIFSLLTYRLLRPKSGEGASENTD